jgi:LmbE family N-acetylglucosaminyl deacetylase
MPRLDPSRTPLAEPSALESLSPAELGSMMVVAPHPDDESLGCGGAIAHLVDLKIEVSVAFVSDGTKSHPNSRRYPSLDLRTLREAEARAALSTLGMDTGNGRITFFGLPDAAVPDLGSDDFDSAVDRAVAYCEKRAPETLLLPWRRDPHCDHRASRSIFLAASRQLSRPPRILEYPIWAYESANPDDLPVWGEVIARRMDVAGVLSRKRAAIAAHRSQLTGLIDDDPDGFRLTSTVLAHFDLPWEIYLESP